MSAIIALAAGGPEEAVQDLNDAPAEGATIRSDLELRLLRASVAVSQSSAQAPVLVRRALAVAERYGYVQTVLDTAPQLVDHVICDSPPLSPDQTADGPDHRRPPNAQAHAAASPQNKLLDPLTAAEIRVLEKLAERLSYTDIASELYQSPNTVKTHLRHTYMKLGATSRSSAIKRATSLGIP